ncbi:MAG TPA: hypothetical protein VKD24_08755, partial [Candidatus Angelobacter sp.]|nr:hypothetical protein [Candidatus Angelobacter sp.]
MTGAIGHFDRTAIFSNRNRGEELTGVTASTRIKKISEQEGRLRGPCALVLLTAIAALDVRAAGTETDQNSFLRKTCVPCHSQKL